MPNTKDVAARANRRTRLPRTATERIAELQESIDNLRSRMERDRLAGPRPASPATDDGTSIIALDKFIQATRDSGYKGTASALSELVDNSIQAGATQINISIAAVVGDEDNDIEVLVLDNGCGMDAQTLRQALRFGGSTRFGERTGLGRYGMGLPNASLSQARRVSVYTWQPAVHAGPRVSKKRASTASQVLLSYLDVDDIQNRHMTDVPLPVVAESPPAQCAGPNGTLVVWSRCDRLDNRRISTISRKLESDFGRRFRHYIWNGLQISINNALVKPFDPLYLHRDSVFTGGTPFGDELRYEMRADPGDGRATGWITVRFSELPVHDWSALPNEEKRRIGLSRGAGVSVVRAGREVDYGWFFMGAKHKENYDDWWRCEVRFDPVLDEAFGITHTKQQIRPRIDLFETLSADIEAAARVLNGRARKAHTLIKAQERFSEVERLAHERDHLLPPLPKKVRADATAAMKQLEADHPVLRAGVDGPDTRSRYKIIAATLENHNFYSYNYDGERLVLILNPDHPFHRELYRPLCDSDNPHDQQLRAKLELLLLSAARAEAAINGHHKIRDAYRLEWSTALATLLNG